MLSSLYFWGSIESMKVFAMFSLITTPAALVIITMLQDGSLSEMQEKIVKAATLFISAIILLSILVVIFTPTISDIRIAKDIIFLHNFRGDI